jgi:NADPH2:quinone reductase
VGDAGREEPSLLDIAAMRGANQTLVGYFLGAELFFGTRAHDTIGRLLSDIAAGRLRVVIDRRFALEQAGEAHAFIESRQAFGRVLLIP